jgi:hypothetical protein
MSSFERIAHTTRQLERDGLHVQRIERDEWASRTLPLGDGVIVSYHVERVPDVAFTITTVDRVMK